MMKNICLALVGLAFAGFGCGPRLAQTPYGEKELGWKNYIGKSYSSWDAPQTVPPVENTQPKAPETQVVIQQDTTEVFTPESKAPVAVFEKESVTEVAPAAPAAGEQTYTVQKGDSLWKVAARFYKDGRKWSVIKDANNDVLKGKNSLTPGMKLRIPAP